MRGLLLNYTGGHAQLCGYDPLGTGTLHVTSVQVSTHIVITLSVVVLFVGTRKLFGRIQRELAQLTVVVIGAGPIGLTSALIAVQCKRVNKLVLFEEQQRCHVENSTYQIAIQPSSVTFLRKYGVDFDNLEGLWHEGFFYTRVGIYLEYILHVLPHYCSHIDLRFNNKFSRECSENIDGISGRKLVICADGRNGQSGRALGLSDECIHHSTGAYGALAALERPSQTLVPKPEQRIHNLTFDLSAYLPQAYDDDNRTNFTMKIFGNSRYRFLALAVHKCDSKVVKALRTVLDKSMMRNVFLKCFNTYKRSEEGSVSDSYCLNNMKFSPRLFEIKLSQRTENVAYISDCDLFITIEGEAARSFNFNTGMDVNIGIRSLSSLEPFIEKLSLAQTEYSIMNSLIYKMEHSDKICKESLKYALRESMFT